MSEANKKAYTRTEGEYEELERQLEEAREELGKEIKKAQDFEFAYNHTYDLKCYWEMQYNKYRSLKNERTLQSEVRHYN